MQLIESERGDKLQALPQIRLDLNRDQVSQSSVHLKTIDFQEIDVPLNCGIETADGKINFKPRDTPTTLNIINQNAPEAVVSDITRIIAMGQIDHLDTLIPVHSSLTKICRGIRFYNPTDGLIYVVSGVGLGFFEKGALTVHSPVPSPKTSFQDLKIYKGQQIQGTTIILPSGIPETKYNEGAPGAYTESSLAHKLANTSLMLEKHLLATTPKPVLSGEYVGKKFRGEAIGWWVYTLPLTLWPNQLVYLDKLYGGQRILEAFCFAKGQAQKDLHSKAYAHWQLHNGNSGQVVDGRKKLSAVFTDMSTVTDLSKHDHKKRVEGRGKYSSTAIQEAKICDLRLSIQRIILAYSSISGKPSYEEITEKVPQIIAYSLSGYTSSRESLPNIESVQDMTKKIRRGMSLRPLESEFDNNFPELLTDCCRSVVLEMPLLFNQVLEYHFLAS